MLGFYLLMFDDIEDKNKFEKLYHDYKYLMLYVANQKTNNSSWAEDIVHDAFYNIAKNFDKIKFESEKKTRALVTIITENCALNFIKRESRIKIMEEDETIDDYSTYKKYENHFESSIVNVLYTEAIIKTIDALDFKYASPIKMQAFGYSIEEISEMLNLPPATVKTRLRRGKQQLLEKVSDKDE